MLSALLAVVVMNVVSVADVPSPRPNHWVTDQANVLAPDAEAKLDALAEGLHARRGIELAIVTVDDVRGTPKQFATSLFNAWGIGSAQTNNGVLVLLVMSKRRLEVETGRGIEAALPAAWLADMQTRDMVPQFKAKRFDLGLIAGVQAIVDHLRDAPGESTSTAPVGEYRSDGVVTKTEPSTQPSVTAPASDPQPATSSTRSHEDGPDPTLPIALGGLALIGGGGTALALRGRRRRRVCFACTPPRPMIALDELADDAHLDEGQRAEERIASVNYEVLVCPGCQASRTLRHGRWFSGYGTCSGCAYKTGTSTSTTLVSATYDHGGQVEVRESCVNCSFVDTHIRYTSQLTQSSSSSSDSSSSSFSSSWSSSDSSSSSSSSSSGFSGGSSGGGGAGSSW
jgi:uncharacterized protein